MRLLLCVVLCCWFIGCQSASDEEENRLHIEQEGWLFHTNYIRSINESSWEKLAIQALNNYTDFKLEFSYISTGKPQTCGLYAKGILVNPHAKQHNNKETKILMRPNLIPNSSIWITRHTDNTGSARIQVSIEDIVGFIQACGDAHQYAAGIYESAQ